MNERKHERAEEYKYMRSYEVVYQEVDKGMERKKQDKL